MADIEFSKCRYGVLGIFIVEGLTPPPIFEELIFKNVMDAVERAIFLKSKGWDAHILVYLDGKKIGFLNCDKDGKKKLYLLEESDLANMGMSQPWGQADFTK